MNIHINKHTRLQSWDGTTIFGDFPLHLRSGNLTVTLLFEDADAVRRLYEMLAELLLDIEGASFLYGWSSATSPTRNKRNSGQTGSFPEGG